jgi:drug/metabolite transporter (DMT)-like permease
MTGSDPYAGAWTVRDRGPLPNTLRIAVLLMFVGALAALVGVVVTLTNTDHIRQLFEDTVPKMTPDKIDSATTFAIVQQIVLNVIRAAIWVVLAIFVRQGKQWARILSTLVTIVGVALILRGIGETDELGSAIAGWGQVVCGVLAVILIWLPQSMPWFRPREVVGFDT